MKTKLTFAFAVAAALLTTSMFAGPGFVDRAPAAPTRTTVIAHQPKPTCGTMTITTNAKAGGTMTVPCAEFAKVRAAECRLACK